MGAHSNTSPDATSNEQWVLVVVIENILHDHRTVVAKLCISKLINWMA